MQKSRFTNMVSAIRSELTERCVQVSNAYPRQGPEGKPQQQLDRAIRAVDSAHYDLDRAFHNEYPAEAAEHVTRFRSSNPILMVQGAAEQWAGDDGRPLLISRAVKPRFSTAEHAQVGRALAGAYKEVGDRWLQLMYAYPKSNEPARHLEIARKALGNARAVLEHLGREEHGADRIPSTFYSPRWETLKVSYVLAQ